MLADTKLFTVGKVGEIFRSLAWPAHTGVFIQQSIAGEPPALLDSANTNDTCAKQQRHAHI